MTVQPARDRSGAVRGDNSGGNITAGSKSNVSVIQNTESEKELKISIHNEDRISIINAVYLRDWSIKMEG